MRIALCDDDKNFLYTLNDMINEFAKQKGITVQIDLFFFGEDLLSQPEALYDIIFMDIYLSSDEAGMNGIDTIRRLHLSEKTQVVFTTTSREYAVEAFGLNATHYLLKPLAKEDVYEALSRCLLRSDNPHSRILEIKTKQGLVYVPMEQIIYVEVYNKICQIYTSKDCIQTYSSLDSLFELLDEHIFMRAQRSFIVNMKYIDIFQHDRIVLNIGKEIMLSRKTKAELKEQYQKFLFDLTRRGEL